MEPFVAHHSRWRRSAAIGGCSCFVAGGLWLAGVFGDFAFDEGASIAGWACVAVFGAFAALGLVQLRQDGPALRVDEGGIWRSRPWGEPQTFSWAAIERVEVVAMRRQRFVRLWLAGRERDPLRVARGQGSPFGDVSLGTAGTDARFDDLVAAVERFGR